MTVFEAGWTPARATSADPTPLTKAAATAIANAPRLMVMPRRTLMAYPLSEVGPRWTVVLER
jgi:hypothetical protein